MDLSPEVYALLKELWEKPLPDNPVPPPFRTLPDYHDWQQEYFDETSRLRYWPWRKEFYYNYVTNEGYEID